MRECSLGNALFLLRHDHRNSGGIARRFKGRHYGSARHTGHRYRHIQRGSASEGGEADTPSALLPIVGNGFYTAAAACRSTKNLRLFLAAGVMTWIVIHALIASVPGLICDAITLAAWLIGWFTHERKPTGTGAFSGRPGQGSTVR